MPANLLLRVLVPFLFFAMVLSPHSRVWGADRVGFDSVAAELTVVPQNLLKLVHTPEIQKELRDVFGSENFDIASENADDSIPGADIHAQDQDAIESANDLDDSPFDLVVDRITNKFIENRQDQESMLKNKKDRNKKETI